MDARWDVFVVRIFLTNLCISDIFLSNQNSLISIHFYNVFALDSPKISSVLNSRLPGPPMASAVSYCTCVQ